MKSKVRFVQRLSLLVFSFSFVVMLLYAPRPASPVAYDPQPTYPLVLTVVLISVTMEASVSPATLATMQAERATKEAEFATWVVANPEAATATWEAAAATGEAIIATQEAERTTREAEIPTWEVEYATWTAGYATWEAELATQEVLFSTQEDGIKANPDAAITTSSEVIQPPSTNWTLFNLWLVTLISLGTFVTTTLYRISDERRTRATHELTVAKTQLEIEKLRKEVEETQQKDKKRKQ